MYPYGNYQIPHVPLEQNPYVQEITHVHQVEHSPYIVQDPFDPDRQQFSQLLNLPQWRQLERRVNQLERQNQRQEREIDELQRRVQRISERLRALEGRNHIPYSPYHEEY